MSQSSLRGAEPGAGGFADPRAAEILAIIAKETALDPRQLTPDASVDALGVSSLDMTQAIFAIETRFDIEIPVVSEKAGAEFGTIGDLVAHVLATLDASAGKIGG